MNKQDFILILDNGHGSNTPGKCSPDRTLRKYAWTRIMTDLIAKKARARGIRTEIIVPETRDIPLGTRSARANALARKHGLKKCLFLSIHINAAGADGRWHDATGFSAWVAPNASQHSKSFAAIITAEMKARGLGGNRAANPLGYWTANFAVIRRAACPAVLTENLFQDNKQEAKYLLSPQGQDTIADAHVAAVEKYIASM
ncbi:MAG: N-acetylmuramoyl-L-alanine amidase [Muribaculaceae bacterium]|nr:N-acetylmuramoyl-L-alanine amidase [Muribaculaceae bacterium]